jgi:hypothetical protein
MIRVRFEPEPALAGVLAVTAETRDNIGARVGYIRNDFLGTWVARLRPENPGRATEHVQAFRTRAEAAAWLLIKGGYVQRPEGTP